MRDVMELYAANGLWIWVGLAAALLTIEVLSGSGWLLWASASAGVVGVIAGLVGLDLAPALALFAVLTLASTLLARRYMPRNLEAEGGDINDNVARLVGRPGAAVEAFRGGHGRLAIDGKEWPAQLMAGGELAAGASAEVVAVDGVTLRVRPL